MLQRPRGPRGPGLHDSYAKSHLVRNCRINSFNSTDRSWNAAKARLVAKWTKTVYSRRLHRLKLSMVKESNSSTRLNSQVKRPGPADAASRESHAENTSAVASNDSRVTAPTLAADATLLSQVQRAARCSKGFDVNKDTLTSKNDQPRAATLSYQQTQDHHPPDPMDNKRRSVATKRTSHCQRDRRGENGQSPEQYLAAKKQEAVAQVMAVFNKWLEKRLAVITYAYEAAGASGDPPSGDSGADGSANRQSGNSSRRPKRHLHGDGSDDFSAGGNGNGEDRGGNKRARKEPELERLFACPFYKNDPRAHRKHRSCSGPGWPSIHRLKEHLYRTHRVPKHSCPRCGEVFEGGGELAVHIRADDRCEKRDLLPPQGIDEATEAKLKVRKKSTPGMTDTQRWREIYLTLFPQANPDALPSPYYDSSVAPNKSAAEWAKLKKQIQKELPKQVQRKVERKFEGVQAEVVNGLPDIVRDCVFEIFHRDGHSPADSPAQSPRPASPGYYNDTTANDMKSASFDVSYFVDNPHGPFTPQGTDITNILDFNFDHTFDFGDCTVLDRESDSGYGSIGTVGDSLA